MEKIKKITLHVKKWQVGFMLAVAAIILSYILAVTCPNHSGVITLFHIFGMVIAGGAGTFLFIFSCHEMWERWDA